MDNKQESTEVSIKDIILKSKSLLRYLKSKWLIILIISVLCGLIGLAYAIYKRPVYSAESTFVLDEGNKGSSISQYAGLASLAGIDLSGSGAGGIFQGDNILELYKSRVMLKKTLLTQVNIGGKQQLLIERYIDFNHLREKWKNNDHIESISFDNDPLKFDRKQDSIITDIINYFNNNLLSVTKLDKKLSIIQVSFSSKDEQFAKEFNNKLVETVNVFYTHTKTKKSLQNVQILQRQADSVRNVLNNSISGVASSIDAAPNANPLLVKLRVPSQKRQIDVQSSSAIYSEIVKNLELGKISLRQETPLIQVIDQPVLPLSVKKVTKITGFVLGFVLGGIFIISFILFKKLLKNIVS